MAGIEAWGFENRRTDGIEYSRLAKGWLSMASRRSIGLAHASVTSGIDERPLSIFDMQPAAIDTFDCKVNVMALIVAGSSRASHTDTI